MPTKSRRFGAHPTRDGRIHVATQAYQKFAGELYYLHSYLNSRLLPTEPEDVMIERILTNFQNLLEHEAEQLIWHYSREHGTQKDRKFSETIKGGFVAFRTKCDWLRARLLVDPHE